MPPPTELRNRPQDGILWIQKVAAVELGFWLRPRSFGGTWIYIGGRSTSVEQRGPHEGGGRAPLPRGALVAPPTYSFHPYIPTYPKTSRTEDRSGVPPPQASVATKNQSGPCSGTLPEGGSLTGGHLHHPGALHDEEGVVHPRG